MHDQRHSGIFPVIPGSPPAWGHHPRHSGESETFAKPADPSPSRSVRGREPAQRSSQGMPERRLNPLQFPLGHQGGGFAKVSGKPESRGAGGTALTSRPLVLLPRRSRSYSTWHISPAPQGNPAAPRPRAYPCVRFAPRPLSLSERGQWGDHKGSPLRAVGLCDHFGEDGSQFCARCGGGFAVVRLVDRDVFV